jgi:RimJ/RimL family protein N-acetyltransferase
MSLPKRTDRLVLDPLSSGDRDAFVAYRQVPDVARWQSWTPDYSTADADDLIADQPTQIELGSGNWIQIAIRDAATGELLGDVAVHSLADQPDTYELGVTLMPTSQGRGVATEALGVMVDMLFSEYGAHRLFAITDARNEPVARLFTRLGFRHEGRNVDADWFKGEWTTIDTWALLARER